MKRKDPYCFKSGKLELSLLDEEIDAISMEPSSDRKDSSEQILQNRSVEDKTIYIALENDIKTSRLMHTECLQQPQVKMSDEIYNTLKEMGEFLTQTDVLESKEEGAIINVVQKNEDEAETASFEKYIIKNNLLQQSSIDELLLSHFGEITPKFKYADELKRKIEEQIKKIKG